jgi:hypothetical protein
MTANCYVLTLGKLDIIVRILHLLSFTTLLYFGGFWSRFLGATYPVCHTPRRTCINCLIHTRNLLVGEFLQEEKAENPCAQKMKKSAI